MAKPGTKTAAGRTVVFPDLDDPHVIANCILSILELPDHSYRRADVQAELAKQWHAMPAAVRDRQFGGVFPASVAQWTAMAEACTEWATGANRWITTGDAARTYQRSDTWWRAECAAGRVASDRTGRNGSYLMKSGDAERHALQRGIGLR